MPLINSSSFLLFKDQQVIGHSKNTTLSLNLDLQNSTTKDSGGFTEYLPSITSGTISVEGLTAYDDLLNFDEFSSYVITRSSHIYYFKESSNPELIFRGKGYISSCDETSDSESLTTFNVEIQLTDIITVSDNQDTWENIFDFWEDIATQWENV